MKKKDEVIKKKATECEKLKADNQRLRDVIARYQQENREKGLRLQNFYCAVDTLKKSLDPLYD